MSKGPESLMAVFHTIAARSKAGLNAARRFKWIFLGDRSEIETAKVLQDSLIFIFSSTAEGLGRMPLEAMASGCLLVTYDLEPVTEIAPAYSRFAQNNIVGTVKFIEGVLATYPDNLAIWLDYINLGYKIAGQYTPERQESNVIEVWKKVLEQNR